MTPSVARRNFQKLLEAKQERVRQGPSYPAPNEFTGRHDVERAPEAETADTETAKPPAAEPESEVIYGDPAFEHQDARDRN